MNHEPILPTERYKDLVRQLYERDRVQRALSLLIPANAWTVISHGVPPEQIGVAKRFLLLAKTKGLINHDRYLNAP